MSYILEALKKAENGSGSGSLHVLLRGCNAPRQAARHNFRAYLLIGILCVNAAMMFCWIHPWWHEEQSNQQKRSTVIHLSEASRTAMESAEAPVPALESPRADAQYVRSAEAALPLPRIPAPVKEAHHARVEKTRKIAANAVAAPVQQRNEIKTASPEAKTPSRARVLALSELPGATRQALPHFKISGHAYSQDPAFRVVRINDQVLQEGQSLAPGLKIDEITPNGIILNGQGYRFQIALNAN